MPAVDAPPTPRRKSGGRTRGTWDHARAKKAAALSVANRQANANARLTPEQIADQSLGDLNTLRDDAITALKSLDKADPKRLEWAKILVSIESARLDRTQGRPKTQTGREAGAQLDQFRQVIRESEGNASAIPLEPDAE